MDSLFFTNKQIRYTTNMNANERSFAFFISVTVSFEKSSSEHIIKITY